MDNFDTDKVQFVISNMGLPPSVRIAANRNSLAAASPVFDALLKSSENVIQINDSSPTAFKELLQFIERPNITTLTIENIEDVVRLANDYKIVKNFDLVVEFLQEKFDHWKCVVCVSFGYFAEKRKAGDYL